jgi:putative cardiolipin synthase
MIADWFVQWSLLQSLSAMVLRAAVLLLIGYLGGCASLPSPEPRAPSLTSKSVSGTTLARAAAASTGAGASAFRLLPAGDQALDARLALIDRAERGIELQYYQLAGDSSGMRLVRALRAAAQRGVRVRLLVDDLHVTEQEQTLVALAAEPGMEVRLFNPLPVRDSSLASRVFGSLHQFGRINRRMHNKLFVVDASFAITGGRNIADEYFGRGDEAGFIDMDVLAAGPIVAKLAEVFDGYWNSRHAYPIQQLAQATEQGRAEMEERLASLPQPRAVADHDALGQTGVPEQLAHGRLELIAADADVLADDPDKAAQVGDESVDSTVALAHTELLAQAQHEVLISSPYLVPAPRQLAAIDRAAQRNVDVVLITNSLATTDEPLVHSGYSRYRQALLRMGVSLYELMPLARRAHAATPGSSSPGRLHAKLAVVDRQRVFIGSMNMDRRSARVNTEMGLMIHSQALAEQVARLLRLERVAESFKLRLAECGQRVQWVVGKGPQAATLAAEPDLGVAQSLALWLGERFISEELL